MLIYAKEVLIKLNTHHDETAFSKVRIEMIFLSLLKSISHNTKTNIILSREMSEAFP